MLMNKKNTLEGRKKEESVPRLAFGSPVEDQTAFVVITRDLTQPSRDELQLMFNEGKDYSGKH